MSPRALQSALGAGLLGPVAVFVACSGEGDPGTGTPPPADELVFDAYGSLPINDTGGYIDVTVTVPDGAVSTLAHCGGYGDGALGAIWTLTDPGGSVVYTGDNPGASSFRSDFVDDLSAAVVPMAPALDNQPGDWGYQWFVGAGHDGNADCGAVHRVDTVSDAATIYVEIVLVGLDGLDATTAADDPNLAAALAGLEAEWGTANLTPSYGFVDFAGDVATYTVVDIDTAAGDYGEFNDLLRTASPVGVRTLTFFLVQEIADIGAGGATILGLSAGPPGAAAVHGTSKSGVVVSALDIAAAPGDVGKIMAHEGGHFLGLYHTTEKAGDQHDSLTDTPECPASADADASGTLSASECAGQGGENVMFWTLTSGTASMSTDQSWVLRRSPLAD